MPHLIDSSNTTTLLSELEGFQMCFHASTVKKGQKYHLTKKVKGVKWTNSHTIKGTVITNTPYTVTLLFNTLLGEWEGTCSCPRDYCKHLYAFTIEIGDQLRAKLELDSQNQEESITKKVAALIKQRESFESMHPFEESELLGAIELSQTIERKLNRNLSETELTQLEALLTVFKEWKENNYIEGAMLQELGILGDKSPFHKYQYRILDWLGDELKPQTPLELWHFLAEFSVRTNVELPEFLKRITDFSFPKKRIKAREAVLVKEEWKKRFTALTRQKSMQTTPLLLDIRVRIKNQSMEWEGLFSFENTFRRIKQTDLPALYDDWPKNSFHFKQELLALLSFAYKIYLYDRKINIPLDNQNTLEGFNHILTDPKLRSYVINEEGKPFQEGEPLVWACKKSKEDETFFVFFLKMASGKPLPKNLLYLPGQTPLYLDAQKIYRGPPVPANVDQLESLLIPKEAITTQEGVQFLQDFEMPFPPAIATCIQAIVLKPFFRCDIKKNRDNTTEYLRVCAFGEDEQKTIHQRLDEDGWQFYAEEKRENPSQFYTYNRQALENVPVHLKYFGLSYEMKKSGWLKKMDKDFADSFYNWVETCGYKDCLLVSKELESILKPPVKVDFNFEIEESEYDWFEVRLVTTPTDTELTPQELAILLKAKGKFVRLPNKGWQRIDTEDLPEKIESLEALGLEFKPGETSKGRFHALQLANSKNLDHFVSEEKTLELQERAHQIKAIPPPPIPSEIRAMLRPYQKEGFHFLAYLTTNQFGGILADDMGLGKTLQALTWLIWLREKKGEEPFHALVICPKSVMYNWVLETEKFAPSLTCDIISPEKERPSLEKGSRIWVTNYRQLLLHEDKLTQTDWDAVILDEAQFIKNPNTKSARAACALRVKHRLILTGTPIENKLLDLWSLFAFCMPGLLGTQTSFKRLYHVNSTTNPAKNLANRVRHFLLRRTKKEVAADLPERIEEDILCEMEKEQANLYSCELKRAQQMLLQIKTQKEFNETRFHILDSLLRLRQICCHPSLLDAGYQKMNSTKTEVLLEQIRELCSEGHKVLVFSQFVKMLTIIEKQLMKENIPSLMLTGSTENRQELVETFQSSEEYPVFLLSLKAAGTGLNLTAASYVILYDPWWNPAVEAQAIDRTHRIGQKQTVFAYRLIVKDSLEEKIRKLQNDKKVLADSVIREESLQQVMDLESLKFVLS